MCYIGQSICIEIRYKRHLHSAFSGCDCSDSNTKFHKALREYGIDSFDFNILCTCSASELNMLENKYIIEFNSVANGYNATYGGNYTEHFIKLSVYEVDSIIYLLKNSDWSFRTIADEFNISFNMVRYINYGHHHRRDDEIYPLRPYKQLSKLKYNCINCGCDVYKGSSYCNSCRAKLHIGYTSSSVKPTREVLKDLIRNNSFVAIGKLFNVSDNTIRKWCKGYNLPSRSKDIGSYSDMEWTLL